MRNPSLTLNHSFPGSISILHKRQPWKLDPVTDFNDAGSEMSFIEGQSENAAVPMSQRFDPGSNLTSSSGERVRRGKSVMKR
jgi:hypothetical protein